MPSAYTGAKLDLSGRGWLEFESIQVTDSQLQTTTLTTYNQLFPQTGAVSNSLISQATDGPWMKQTIFTYYPPAQTFANGQYWVAYQILPQTVQSDFYTFAPPPAAPTNPPTLDATYQKIYQQYDAYGNPTLTIDMGDSTLYTSANYDNDPTQWRLGYLAEQKATRDSAGTEVLT